MSRSVPTERGPDALTKIVATLGPASSSAEGIDRLIAAGVSIFRINFSHGDLDSHAAVVERVRVAAKTTGRPIAILGDLQGPKIRVSGVDSSGFDVEAGDALRIVGEATDSTDDEGRRTIGCTWPALVTDVQPGERVLINDGAIRMLAVAREGGGLLCTVTHGGRISAAKGINVPDSDLSTPSLTDRDWECLDWAIEHGLDLVALSFVRNAADIELLRRGINERIGAVSTGIASVDGPPLEAPAIIAKIELPRAVENIESIVEVVDGIMVARGDLGVEMDIARLPVIQKQLIAIARSRGRPCIVATQMLESMIDSPTPTRAEATDVANAIFDSTDAIMLSGETAVGRFGDMAVDHMRRIALYTEQHQRETSGGIGGVALTGRAGVTVKDDPPYIAHQAHTDTHAYPAPSDETEALIAALAHGVHTVAEDVGAKFIVAWSQSGTAARLLSQQRFHIPIIAASTDVRAARRMQLLRGVTAVRMKQPESMVEFTELADAYLIHSGLADGGERCIMVSGWPPGEERVTNRLAIHTVRQM